MTPSETDFHALEQRLLDAEVRQSAADLETLLAPEFREFGSSGRVTDRATVLGTLRPPHAFELSMHAFAVHQLAADVAFTTYQATARNLETGRTSHSLRSTIWRRQNRHWQVVFHQGTRTDEPIS